jgi:hypothetical protein
VERGDDCVELQREAGDDLGGAVQHGRVTDDDELYGHEPDQRDGLLLCCVGGKCEWGEWELEREVGDTASASSVSVGIDRYSREPAGRSDLERGGDGVKLQRQAVDDVRWAVQHDCVADHDQLHGHQPD